MNQYYKCNHSLCRRLNEGGRERELNRLINAVSQTPFHKGGLLCRLIVIKTLSIHPTWPHRKKSQPYEHWHRCLSGEAHTAGYFSIFSPSGVDGLRLCWCCFLKVFIMDIGSSNVWTKEPASECKCPFAWGGHVISSFVLWWINIYWRHHALCLLAFFPTLSKLDGVRVTKTGTMLLCLKCIRWYERKGVLCISYGQFEVENNKSERQMILYVLYL